MPGKVCVLNRKNLPLAPSASSVVIMRPGLFGNPYPITPTATRDQVIDRYRLWLRAEYRKHGEIYHRLNALARRYRNGETIYLICCCKPLPCHGDVIADAIQGIAHQL